MQAAISVASLSKVYDGGHTALKDVSIDIREGEILALLGPNGAGKTTLISTICGLTRPTSGSVHVMGHDIQRDYRAARKLIGLVPQEIMLEHFETVNNTVTFSRGLFGLPPDPARIEKILRDLSLWDKRDSQIKALSGGMKRRVLIAKALSHEPRVLFLDEPTAGVDVELRKDMWDLVERLSQDGVTTILTTHYIEEAEAIADRVGVINAGQVLLVQPKDELMRQLGKKALTVHLQEPVTALPPALSDYDLTLAEDGRAVIYHYDTAADRTGITTLLAALNAEGLKLSDLSTKQSTLEEIFVDLVRADP
ncbi:ABC transporter ATP-binding protein [Halovulum sp. GXIMD14793]